MGNENNLRHWLGVHDDYVRYCREERNFAAVLYHLLLEDARLRSFLVLTGRDADLASGARVYFEYAHLRDLWAAAARDEASDAENNARYRDAIACMLGRPDVELPTDCQEFNEFFIGKGAKAASARYIRMPSRWSDSQFRKWCEHADRSFAERVCALKWSFNAKPDLVLHLRDDTLVCIEAKLESDVGGYRVDTDHHEGPFRWKQTRLQEFILQDILGYSTDFLIISKNRRQDVQAPWRRFTWHEVFEALRDDENEARMVGEFRRSRFIAA